MGEISEGYADGNSLVEREELMMQEREDNCWRNILVKCRTGFKK